MASPAVELHNLYDALLSINVPTEKARAVIDALEEEMRNRLATKADLEAQSGQFRHEAQLIRKDLEIGLRDVTIRNGYMLAVGLGILFAALKFT